MKKALMFLLALSLAVLAQKPTVAIGAIGDEPENSNALKGLSTKLTEAIVNSGKYMAVERSEAIREQLVKEHEYQRHGAVDDEQIKKLGKHLGVQYMCIVESGKVMGEYQLSARLVDVETALIPSMGSEFSNLKDTKELMRVAEELAKKLEINLERRYLVNFATEPIGAVLSFNGASAANCAKTPCKTELAEGNVRIIAKLDQYETADTTVSIKPENQNVSIRLKAKVAQAEPVKASTAPPSVAGGSSSSVLTDSRDGKKYKVVKIGNQTWMAENLNYEVSDRSDSKCYGNKPENCAKYGRLYKWNAANKSACPSGWHLPSEAELDVLMKTVGGQNVAGKKLKAKSDWKKDGNGTDEFGFSALPGGYGDSGGSFYDVHDYGYWWSANKHGDILYTTSYYWSMSYDSGSLGWNATYRSNLASVRCVKD